MAEDTLNWWICRRAKQEKYGRQWYVKTCRQITRATMTWERRNRTRWSANSEIGQDPCRPPAREDGHRSNRKTRQNQKHICCGYKDGEDNEKIAKCLQHQGENRYLVLAKPRRQRTKSANECDERHYVYDQVPFFWWNAIRTSLSLLWLARQYNQYARPNSQLRSMQEDILSKTNYGSHTIFYSTMKNSIDCLQ